MIGTKQAAAILGVRPSTLAKAVWDGRIDPPVRGPGGAFIWTDADVQRAARALGRCLDELVITREAADQ